MIVSTVNLECIHINFFLIFFVSIETCIAFNFVRRMAYLEKRCQHLPEVIETRFPQDRPVILLLDNINLYRGNKRHHRLFKVLGPKMWNFTGRAALLPNLTGMEDMLRDDKECLEPQGSIKELKAEQVFLGMCHFIACSLTIIMCIDLLS